MRTIIGVALIALSMSASSTSPYANYLEISVLGPDSAVVRAIWRPYAGVVPSRGENQQARLRDRRSITHPDSLRRWQDPAARDTIVIKAPVKFIVDMSGGPVLIQADDSIHVEAQLTPPRGPIRSTWGRNVLVESNGVAPLLVRKQ